MRSAPLRTCMGSDSDPARSSQSRVTILVEKSRAMLRTPERPVLNRVLAILVVTSSNRLFKTARVTGSRRIGLFLFVLLGPFPCFALILPPFLRSAENLCNASLFRANLRRSDRDVGENLIAVTSVCPSHPKVTSTLWRLRCDHENYPCQKNTDNPLHKIFTCLPVGKETFLPGRRTSPTLQ